MGIKKGAKEMNADHAEISKMINKYRQLKNQSKSDYKKAKEMVDKLKKKIDDDKEDIRRISVIMKASTQASGYLDEAASDLSSAKSELPKVYDGYFTSGYQDNIGSCISSAQKCGTTLRTLAQEGSMKNRLLEKEINDLERRKKTWTTKRDKAKELYEEYKKELDKWINMFH